MYRLIREDLIVLVALAGNKDGVALFNILFKSFFQFFLVLKSNAACTGSICYYTPERPYAKY